VHYTSVTDENKLNMRSRHVKINLQFETGWNVLPACYSKEYIWYHNTWTLLRKIRQRWTARLWKWVGMD